MTTVQDLMDRASAMIREDPDKARKFGGVCKFALSGEGRADLHHRPHRRPAGDRR